MDFLQAIYNAIKGFFEFCEIIIGCLVKLVMYFVQFIEILIDAFL